MGPLWEVWGSQSCRSLETPHVQMGKLRHGEAKTLHGLPQLLSFTVSRELNMSQCLAELSPRCSAPWCESWRVRRPRPYPGSV